MRNERLKSVTEGRLPPPPPPPEFGFDKNVPYFPNFAHFQNLVAGVGLLAPPKQSRIPPPQHDFCVRP